MPAYSFHKRFIPAIMDGTKRHTIRGKRKARPRVGQMFYAFTGMRTKSCQRLFESPIVRVQDIRLFVDGDGRAQVEIDGVLLAEDELEALAKADGFKCWRVMAHFWNGLYPFAGDLIHWKWPIGD